MKHEREFESPGANWQHHIRFDVNPPRLAMRIKVNGRWEYREPTRREVDEYNQSEAW